MVIGNMVECVECGKRLGFFRYYHPMLGRKSMVCGPCLLRIDESVEQWREFVLSNSFNPESSSQILSINWGSFSHGITEIKKKIMEGKEKKSDQLVRSKTMSYEEHGCSNIQNIITSR